MWNTLNRHGVRKRLIAVLLLAGQAILVACGQDTRGIALQQVPDGNAAQGRQTVQKYGCGACHVIPGAVGANGVVGPPLTAFARRKYIAGVLPNTPENLIAWIQNPQAIEPGTAMPNLDVSGTDARDIAAYLATLK